jgi:SOS-response transcriptional repressor LexA
LEDISEAAERVYQVLSQLLAIGEHPSERELADTLGLAVSTVNTHLNALRAAGWAHRTEGKARSFKIVGGPLHGDAHSFDLTVSAIAAGPPSPAAPIADAVDQSGYHLQDGHIFTIRAEGDSMVDKGIQSGDILTVRAQVHGTHGDIVVACILGEAGLDTGATVKQLDLSRERPRLLPANPAYAPIEADSIAIIGKVIDVSPPTVDRATS